MFELYTGLVPSLPLKLFPVSSDAVTLLAEYIETTSCIFFDMLKLWGELQKFVKKNVKTYIVSSSLGDFETFSTESKNRKRSLFEIFSTLILHLARNFQGSKSHKGN